MTAYERILTARATGHVYEHEKASIELAEMVEEPPERVWLLELGLPPSSPAICRTRITKSTETGAVTTISTSWFPPSLAETSPLLLSTERILEGTTAYIEHTSGRRVTLGRDRVAVSTADACEALALGICEGDPVRHTRTTLIDSGGMPVEYSDAFSATGRWATYTYTFK
jgi:DNA-binding GntR family transcriptional regulator